MKLPWTTLVTLAFASLTFAILGTWLAVVDGRIAAATGLWTTLAIGAVAALLFALGRQSEHHRSVGMILDDLENPGRRRVPVVRD